MSNFGQCDDTALSPERAAVVGTLLSAANVRALPARPWPLVAALQILAGELPRQSRHRDVIYPALDNLKGARVIESWLRELVRTGAMQTAGSGMTAHWVPDSDWLLEWGVMSGLIDGEDSGPWAAAVQALATNLSRWQKAKSAA